MPLHSVIENNVEKLLRKSCIAYVTSKLTSITPYCTFKLELFPPGNFLANPGSIPDAIALGAKSRARELAGLSLVHRILPNSETAEYGCKTLRVPVLPQIQQYCMSYV
jgi:hypothetical protein